MPAATTHKSASNGRRYHIQIIPCACPSDVQIVVANVEPDHAVTFVQYLPSFSSMRTCASGARGDASSACSAIASFNSARSFADICSSTTVCMMTVTYPPPHLTSRWSHVEKRSASMVNWYIFGGPNCGPQTIEPIRLVWPNEKTAGLISRCYCPDQSAEDHSRAARSP